MARFSSLYDLGSYVYLRMRDIPLRGQVTAVTFVPGGTVVYGVTWGDQSESRHYAGELTTRLAETAVDVEDDDLDGASAEDAP